MPPFSSAALTCWNDDGSQVTSNVSPERLRSSAPASSTTPMSVSSSAAAAGTPMSPLRSNR